MKRLLPTLSLAAGALFFCTSLAMAQQSINKTFNGVKKIRISTASGSCRLQKSTDNAVKVNLTYTYKEDQYQPRIEMEGDRLVIKESFNGNSVSGNASWSLTIPDGLNVNFTTGSGDLEIAGLDIQLNATTGSGNLVFTNTKGEIESTTGSGNVEISGFAGDIRANTGSGDMRVEKSTGDITLNCGSGDLRLADNEASFMANTGSGNITAKNMTIAGSSKFNTGSGNAELILAATPTFDLSINSGSGDATLDFNGNEIKGEIVMKASKRNGKIVAPFEFDTTEELNEWGDNVTVKKTVVKGNGTNRISVGTGSGRATIEK